jgi:hypothetical protein
MKRQPFLISCIWRECAKHLKICTHIVILDDEDFQEMLIRDVIPLNRSEEVCHGTERFACKGA